MGQGLYWMIPLSSIIDKYKKIMKYYSKHNRMKKMWKKTKNIKIRKVLTPILQEYN